MQHLLYEIPVHLTETQRHQISMFSLILSLSA